MWLGSERYLFFNNEEEATMTSSCKGLRVLGIYLMGVLGQADCLQIRVVIALQISSDSRAGLVGWHDSLGMVLFD